MHRMNWDDLQFVLAVVEAGTVAGAARALGVNHATVLRRIAAFEDRLGTELFERSPLGYRVRPDRLRLIEAAREVGHAVESMARLARGMDAPPEGHLRITSTDTLCQTLLPRILAEFRETATGLRLSLVSSNLHLNLSRLEAELTVRPAPALPEGLVGEIAGRMDFAVYAAPGTPPDAWLGLSGPLIRTVAATWTQDQIGPLGPVSSADSFLVLRALALAGVGRVALPCLLGEAEPGLERIDIDLPAEFSVPLWVACHEDIAQVPRIRQMRTLLSEAVARHAGMLQRPG